MTTLEQTNAAANQESRFDPDFLEAVYRISAIEILRGISGISGGIADTAEDFRNLNLEFLDRFGGYLVSLNEDEKRELDVLLHQRLDESVE